MSSLKVDFIYGLPYYLVDVEPVEAVGETGQLTGHGHWSVPLLNKIIGNWSVPLLNKIIGHWSVPLLNKLIEINKRTWTERQTDRLTHRQKKTNLVECNSAVDGITLQNTDSLHLVLSERIFFLNQQKSTKNYYLVKFWLALKMLGQIVLENEKSKRLWIKASLYT